MKSVKTLVIALFPGLAGIQEYKLKFELHPYFLKSSESRL
jgi:hypothetical protein